MQKTIFRIIIILFVIAINVGIDQVTKYYAKTELRGRDTVRVIGDFFILRYAENNGAFLGMFSSLPGPVRLILLSFLPIIAVTGMLVWLFMKEHLTTLHLVFMSTFLGGGISNLFDRLTNNEFVIDFMNFGIGPVLRTGILNVADLSIMAGAIGTFVLFTRTQKQPVQSKGE